MQAPGTTHKLNYLQHREEKVAADLQLIATLLSSSRQNGTIGDMGASYTSQASLKGTRSVGAAKTVMATTTKRAQAASKSKCGAMQLLCVLLLRMGFVLLYVCLGQ